METKLPQKSEGKRFLMPLSSKQRVLLVLGVCLLVVVALATRIYTLDLLYDRDSYDEGVYLQTLRAMSSGLQLYDPIFYSQPPMFLLSIFPTYMALGETLWAARMGIVLISFVGLVGIFLFGKAVYGYLGALVGLLLYVLNAQYLAASQTIQAEIPQVAFTLLAIGFAYMWWYQPIGRKGILYASLCAMTLSLSILSKLNGVATVVPILCLAIAHIYRTSQQPMRIRLKYSLPLLIGAGVFVLTSLLVVAPFFNVFPAFWTGNVTFHTDAVQAEALYALTSNDEHIKSNNQLMLELINAPLTYAALVSLILALWKRDWLVLPLLAWYLVNLILLYRHMPLFYHHFVTVTPALITIIIMGLRSLSGLRERPKRTARLVTSLCIFTVAMPAIFGIAHINSHYAAVNEKGTHPVTIAMIKVAQDLKHVLKPGDLVITDAQFLVAISDHSTPPTLVDTSGVRVRSEYLTLNQLIAEAKKPEVKAVLFYTYRLDQLPGFYDWVQQHYRLEKVYGFQQQLWVKIE